MFLLCIRCLSGLEMQVFTIISPPCCEDAYVVKISRQFSIILYLPSRVEGERGTWARGRNIPPSNVRIMLSILCRTYTFTGLDFHQDSVFTPFP